MKAWVETLLKNGIPLPQEEQIIIDLTKGDNQSDLTEETLTVEEERLAKRSRRFLARMANRQDV